MGTLISNIDVEVTIFIIVAKNSPCAPSFITNARGFCAIGERPVSIVALQDVWAIVSEVEV